MLGSELDAGDGDEDGLEVVEEDVELELLTADLLVEVADVIGEVLIALPGASKTCPMFRLFQSTPGLAADNALKSQPSLDAIS